MELIAVSGAGTLALPVALSAEFVVTEGTRRAAAAAELAPDLGAASYAATPPTRDYLNTRGCAA
jgi:hypothetical protein